MRFSITILMVLPLIIYGYKVTLYEDHSFKGKYSLSGSSYTIEAFNCQNLPEWLREEASSVNAHGHCVAAYYVLKMFNVWNFFYSKFRLFIIMEYELSNYST